MLMFLSSGKEEVGDDDDGDDDGNNEEDGDDAVLATADVCGIVYRNLFNGLYPVAAAEAVATTGWGGSLGCKWPNRVAEVIDGGKTGPGPANGYAWWYGLTIAGLYRKADPCGTAVQYGDMCSTNRDRQAQNILPR